MTTATALALNNSLERGSIGTAGFSTPSNPLLSRVKTAIESIKIELPKSAKAISHQFSSISAQPVLGKFKEFIASTKQRFAPKETSLELVEMSDNSEISALVEAFENEASLPATLSQFAFAVLEKAKTAVTDPKATFEKADEVFAAVKKKVDALETPLEFVSCGLEWAALTETLEHHAETITNGLGKVTAPLALINLIAKMKKIHKVFFGPKIEGAEATKPSEVVSMGFSLVATVCSTISWLQKLGVLTPAMALAGRLNAIGGLCNLMIAIIDLGDNIKNYKSLDKLVKALLNMAVAVVTIVLLVYAVSHLNLLLLIMGTGILILNIACPDKEEDEVEEHIKEVH